MKTFSEILQELTHDARARLPDVSFAPGTDSEIRTLRVPALALLGAYADQARIERDLFPDTAIGDGLDRWGGIKGVPRKGAVGGSASAGLRVTGTNGSILVGTETLTHQSSGQQFKLSAGGTIGAPLFLDLDVAAVSTGKATNLAAGETLVFDSPPAGVDTDAVLQKALTGGDDEEPDAVYGPRQLKVWKDPLSGGKATDYEQESLLEDGVAAAFVYPNRDGAGSVDLAATHSGTGSVRHLDATERASLQSRIDSFAPLGAVPRVLETTSNVVDVEIAIDDIQSRWDWNDSTALTVDTYTSGTKTLEFTVDRPADMQPGDRIIIKRASGDGDGEQVTIASFGAGSDEVVLAAAPSSDPVNGDTIYSGGDIVDAVREDINTEYFDLLGPARGSFASGAWQSIVSPSAMAVALAKALPADLGEISVIAPSATVTPVDPAAPSNSTIELAISGRVIVRRLHL